MRARPVLIRNYIQAVAPTDKMPPELQPVLFGLFGEVGSVMAASKKLHREGKAYAGFRQAAIEEFGDVLWYLAAIARRLRIQIDEVFANAIRGQEYETAIAANDLVEWPLAVNWRITPVPLLDPTLLRLGESAGTLLSLTADSINASKRLRAFVICYVNALQAAGMSFGEVADYNAAKTIGRFIEPELSTLPTFDDHFDAEERIPDEFEIRISQRKSGKSYLQWNGVFVGEPLTDNILDEDGYRFHDVFHLAHATVLHWSPVFRALIKHKRKSDPRIDEIEDGGRAIVIEEGLTAWIFSQAKGMGFFADRDSVSFDLLKAIQKFVVGYEVDQCPLKQWERAILQGYRAFLHVRANNGGVLIGNRRTRALNYRPLK